MINKPMEVGMKLVSEVVAMLAGMLLSMEVSGQMGMMKGQGMMGGSMVRHRHVMHNGIDSRYRDKVNPLKSTPETIKAGKASYSKLCGSCHGPTGAGDGPAGKSLNPPAANLAAVSQSQMWSDGFLYWTISEGGTQLKTAMPPFKASLKEKEIWQIILYLRSL